MVVGRLGLGERIGGGDRHASPCRSASSGSTERSIARAVIAFSSSGRARSVEAWIRPRLPISTPRFSSALAPAPIPITAIRPQRVQRGDVVRQVGRADQLEDHVERAVLAEALGLDHLGAERGHLGAQIGIAHRRGHAGAGGAAELDRRRADAAGAAVDEQALAGLRARPA